MVAEGREVSTATELPVNWNAATPGYFAALRAPILRGRDFTPRDDSAGTTAMIVMSRSMAGDRLLAVLVGAFASLALLLAAVRIFGVLSYRSSGGCTNWAFVPPSVRSASTWCDARAGASRIERRPDHRIARRVAGGSVRAAKQTAGVTTTRRMTGRRQILT